MHACTHVCMYTCMRVCMYSCMCVCTYLFMIPVDLPTPALLFRMKLYSAVVWKGGEGGGTCSTSILGVWGFILVRLLLKFPGQFRHNFNLKDRDPCSVPKILKNFNIFCKCLHAVNICTNKNGRKTRFVLTRTKLLRLF